MTGINEKLYVSTDAFSAAVATHHRRLAGLAYLLCGDKTVAEDLVAEAYAKVWPKYRQQQVEDLGPYLRQSVVNLATGRLRRLRLERRETQRRTIDWRIAEDRNTPSFESSVDERDELWQAIWRLPADQRAVIVLRLVEDMSEEATAKVLGTRPGTVKSRLARGLATLRTELSPTAIGSDMRGDVQ
jgi:RNA polymerase sigma-70 factor (sigma-E family)